MCVWSISVFVPVLLAGACAPRVGEYAVVISEAANVRVGRDVIETLSRGHVFVVLETCGYALGVSNGRFGYIHNRQAMPLRESLPYFDRLVQHGPDNSNAYCARGSVHYWLGKSAPTEKEATASFALAAKDFADAIRLFPKNRSAFCGQAWVHYDRGEFQAALTSLDEVLRLKSDEADALHFEAWIWATCDDPKFRNGDRAIATAKRACELHGNTNYRDFATLAAAHAEARQWDDAVQWQQKALDACHAQEQAEFSARLELYKAKKPYRAPSKIRRPDLVACNAP